MGVADRWVVLGKVSGVYGVAGWVKVFSYTQPLEGILDYRNWYLAGPSSSQRRPVSLRVGRRQGKSIVASLDECEDRDRATALVGFEIAVPRTDLPSIAADEYYWADLIGLRVVAADGVDLGRVDHLLETGANDVMVVRGERERLIPFLPERVVRQVDVESGTIRVDWDSEF